MIKNLCLAAVLFFAPHIAAHACTPVPPTVVTEKTYEQLIEPYFQNTHRLMVDTADNIVIGKFKFSDRKQAHRLKITKTLKRSKNKRRKKRVYVTFPNILEYGITYSRETALVNRADIRVNQFIPTPSGYQMSGSSFDTSGSCGTNLELNPDLEYLVFANENFEITSMFILSERTQTFLTAVENMVQDPQDPFGVSVSLQQTIEHGHAVKLLQTTTCSPMPTYKILQSYGAKYEMTNFTALPIMIFEGKLPISPHDLSRADLKQARSLGQKNGLYTNVPSLETCQTGQRFLNLGQFLFPQARSMSGQMIAEKNGHFDLANTVFEYHITPEKVTFDEVVELLNNMAE